MLESSGMDHVFNSSITLYGEAYHVQTEDWVQQKCVVTQIFKNGAVLKIVRSHYVHLVDSPVPSSKELGLAMRDQHQKILDQLVSGQF